MIARIRTHGPEALFYLLWSLALVGLRSSQVLSELDRFYDLEFTIMGQLALSVAHGTLDMSDPFALLASYQYMAFAPGTLVAQVLTLLFSVPLGANGFALIGSSVACEVAFLVAWIYCGRSMLSRRWVCLSLLPVLFAPWHAVQWQLMPFGNHSEFLVVPMVALAFHVRAVDIRWWHWLGLLAWVAAGVFLYRLNLASAAGLTLAALTVRESRRPTAALLVTAALACLVLVLLRQGPGLGFSGELVIQSWEQLSPMSLWTTVWDKVPQLAHPCWGMMTACEPITAPPGWNVVYKSILVGFAPVVLWVGYRHPATRTPAAFVFGWCVAAFLIPIVIQREGLALLPSRYFLATFYALLACGLVALGRGGTRLRVVVALGFVLLTVGGLDVARRHHHPEKWSANRQLDVLALGHRIGATSVYLDDMPYYERTLRARRDEPYVHNQATAHILDNDTLCCPGGDGLPPAVPHCLRPQAGLRWHDPLSRSWHELLPADGSSGVPPDMLPLAVFVGDTAWAGSYGLELLHGEEPVAGELEQWSDPGDGPGSARRWVRFVPDQPLIPDGRYLWRASPGHDALERLPYSDTEEVSFVVGEEFTTAIPSAPVLVSASASGARAGAGGCGWDGVHRVDLRIDVQPTGPGTPGQLHLFARADGASQRLPWRTALVPESYTAVHLTYLVRDDGGSAPPLCLHAVHVNAAGESSDPSEERCLPFVD